MTSLCRCKKKKAQLWIPTMLDGATKLRFDPNVPFLSAGCMDYSLCVNNLTASL